MIFDHILIIGFGGPTKPEEIRPFINNVTRGIPIPEERLKEVEHHYHVVGGKSPYNEFTFQLVEKLRLKLRASGIELPVFVGMRNWDPFLKDTLRDIKERSLKHGIGVILAPHVCDSSFDKYIRNVESAKNAAGAQYLQYAYLKPWYRHPGFVAAQAGEVVKVLKLIEDSRQKNVSLLFSAHSIPLEMDARSSYSKEVEISSRLVAEKLGISKWRLAWQSRSGSPRQPWLEPDIVSVMRAMRAEGHETICVVPIGFLCDNVEVLFDLDIELREEAEKLGIPYLRARAVTDHDEFVAMFVELILNQEVFMSGIQNAPYVKEEQPGKKAYCTCGLSVNQPYCDGAHSRNLTGKSPRIVEITEAKTVAWCGCRASKTLPFCDGTHKSI